MLDDAAVAQHENVQPQPQLSLARKQSCSTLVLIGVAAFYCKTVVKNGDWREGSASPISTKEQTTSASGGACPPQWLPVLLAFHSRHDDNPASTFDALSTWQCNPQDGSVSQNGVAIGVSVPCNSGLTGPNRQAEATVSSGCASAEMLAAIEKKEVNRRNLQVVVVRHDEDISWSDSFAAVRTLCTRSRVRSFRCSL